MLRRSAALSVLMVGLASAGAPLVALAQSSIPADDSHLTDTQREGRAIFAQSCGVCHLPPVMNAPTYGPALSQDTAGGSAEIIRVVIADGTPRMPAFKHYLGRTQIDAVISYLKTVPTPPASPAQAR